MVDAIRPCRLCDWLCWAESLMNLVRGNLLFISFCKRKKSYAAWQIFTFSSFFDKVSNSAFRKFDLSRIRPIVSFDLYMLTLSFHSQTQSFLHIFWRLLHHQKKRNGYTITFQYWHFLKEMNEIHGVYRTCITCRNCVIS